MTLSIADFEDETAHYAYQCATCSARYIVNIQPTAGNGGAGLYGYRQTPHGADEARAMALHCCHDDPEPANGQNVYWAPSPLVGAQTFLYLGAQPPLEVAVVREYREHVVEFVKAGESAIWQYCRETRRIPYAEQNDFEILGVRLDCMIDDNPEGRRRSWAALLANLRLQIQRGDRTVTGFSMPSNDKQGDYSGWTFSQVTFPDVEDDKPADPLMCHAHVRLDGALPGVFPIHVVERQVLRAELVYPSAIEIPVGFLRLVIRGNELVA